jgi:hypothetical protein
MVATYSPRAARARSAPVKRVWQRWSPQPEPPYCHLRCHQTERRPHGQGEPHDQPEAAGSHNPSPAAKQANPERGTEEHEPPHPRARATSRRARETGGPPRRVACSAALPPQNSTATGRPKRARSLPPARSGSGIRSGGGIMFRLGARPLRKMATARASASLRWANHGHGMARGSSRRPLRAMPRLSARTISSSLQRPRPVSSSAVKFRLYHTPPGVGAHAHAASQELADVIGPSSAPVGV